MSNGKKIRMWSILLAAAAVAGCVATDDTAGSLYQRLQAEDPAVRIQAAHEAATKDDHQAVGLLIDRLDDPENDVRLFSHIALQKITGQDFGWQSWAPAGERADAVKKWRAWWLQQQGASPKAATSQGAAAEWMKQPAPKVPPAKETPAPQTQPPTGNTAGDTETVTPALAEESESQPTTQPASDDAADVDGGDKAGGE